MSIKGLFSVLIIGGTVLFAYDQAKNKNKVPGNFRSEKSWDKGISMLSGNDLNYVENIQSQILEAAKEPNSEKAITKLLMINHKLGRNNFNENTPVLVYWKALTLYFLSIKYDQSGKENLSNTYNSEGQSLLANKKDANSEELALLSMLQNYSIKFATILNYKDVSDKAMHSGLNALALNTHNPRAYLALAEIDFYTPQIYNGRGKCEHLLLTALNLRKSSSKPGYPSWGRERTFLYLIEYYKSVQDNNAAIKYLRMARIEFPGNSTILFNERTNNKI